MLVQAFYNEVTKSVLSTMDAVASGTLMNNTKYEAYNLIEEMVLNNYEWSNERSQPMRVESKLELDAFSVPSAKVDTMSQRLEHLNVDFVSSNAPSLSCVICGSIDHLSMNFQVGTPFAQDNRD